MASIKTRLFLYFRYETSTWPYGQICAKVQEITWHQMPIKLWGPQRTTVRGLLVRVIIWGSALETWTKRHTDVPLWMYTFTSKNKTFVKILKREKKLNSAAFYHFTTYIVFIFCRILQPKTAFYHIKIIIKPHFREEIVLWSFFVRMGRGKILSG